MADDNRLDRRRVYYIQIGRTRTDIIWRHHRRRIVFFIQQDLRRVRHVLTNLSRLQRRRSPNHPGSPPTSPAVAPQWAPEAFISLKQKDNNIVCIRMCVRVYANCCILTARDRRERERENYRAIERDS